MAARDGMCMNISNYSSHSFFFRFLPDASLPGEDITKHRKRVVRNIGVVFGQRSQLNWDLRPGESFELLKHIYQIDQGEYEKTLDVMDDILGIKELIDKPVRQMSLGQRVKGDLAASMLHSPKGLFLVPTIGPDVSIEEAGIDDIIKIAYGSF